MFPVFIQGRRVKSGLDPFVTADGWWGNNSVAVFEQRETPISRYTGQAGELFIGGLKF